MQTIDEVNERSTWITDISFTDENGDPVVPSIASYRVDDVGTDVEIRDDTTITFDSPPGPFVSVEWTKEDTSILDERHPYETRRMTVSWEYDTDKHGNAEYLLNVRNLKGITTPSPP